MGKFNATNQVVQTLAFGQAIFATGAFWNNSFYLAGVSGHLKTYAFNTSTGKFNTSAGSQSPTSYGFPGATPAVSATGTANGIIWAIDASAYGSGPAIVHAYDATNLASELWNSSQAAASRDKAGNAVKFTVPTISNGKVYVGTSTEITVFGLLPN
jgi:outer membrane protein assembly factor BamB